MSEQNGYSADQHAAAWASYYAQQGYTPDQILASTGYDMTTGQYVGGGSMAGSSAAGASGSAYDATASAYATAGAGAGAGASADLLAQSNMYDPNAPVKAAKEKVVTGKRDTVLRKGNGKVWEDPTLIDWDPKWYRIFVGDLSNDVNERTLDAAFGHFASFCKSKVIRDRLSLKAKYGFVAFKDPEDFLKAWKTMDGKYVGQRPIRLMKVREDKYGGIETKTLSARKAKEMDKVKKNKGQPLNGRPTPY